MKIVRHRLEALLPFIIGFSLTVEGWEKVPEETFAGMLIMLFGVTLLVYALYALKKKGQEFVLKVAVHLFEAVTLLFVSYIYFEEGKKYLPYFNLAPSIALFISVVVMLFKRNKEKMD
jgi:hypothetical protein